MGIWKCQACGHEHGVKPELAKAESALMNLLSQKYVFIEQFGDKKTGLYWHIELKIGHQYFLLNYAPESQKDAERMQEILGKALEQIVLNER